jgi:ribosomal protein S18 acetylase RimI-like enzyme
MGTTSVDGLPDDLVIAAARADDRAAVAELWRQTGLTTSYNNPFTDFDRARGKPNSDVLVGKIAERVVASVMVGHDGHRGWLYYVAVDPAWQGRGYGTAMVAAAEAWLRERGVPKAQLLIRARNTKVQAFYERLAYERSDVVMMQRWLVPPGK